MSALNLLEIMKKKCLEHQTLGRRANQQTSVLYCRLSDFWGGTCPLSATDSAGPEAFKPLLNSMDLFCCVHQAISLGMFYITFIMAACEKNHSLCNLCLPNLLSNKVKKT